MSAEAEENDAGSESYGDELRKGTELLRGQYRIARFLNAGGFGITYLARDSLERIVVIKECFPSSMCCRQDGVVRARSKTHEKEFETIVKLFGQEARALAKVEHPNVVGVHQVFEDNNTAYMALDFVRGRDFLDIMDEEPDRLTPELIRHVVVKSLEAVEYVHERGILHRDISPDNILLGLDDEPVLIDFGAAREEATRVSRVLSQQHTVKDGYSPQEFYVSGSAQTPCSDLYALGATFYHLISGDPPPISQTRLAAVAANRRDPFVPLSGRFEDYDRFFLAAIDKALELFPDDRMQTAREWLTEIDMASRQAAAKDRANRDKELQAVIRELVAETNKAVQEAIARDAGGKKKKPGAADKAKPKKNPLFPDLMGPPPPEHVAGGSDTDPLPAPDPDAGSDQDGMVARPAITPTSVGDEAYLQDETRRHKLLGRVLNVSLWRFGQVEDSQGEIAGKVDR